MPGPTIRRLYYSASEIADIAQIKPYLLTSWEAQFPQLKSTTRGGRRLFTPADLQMVLKIKRLKDEGFSNDQIREELFHLKTRKTREGTAIDQTVSEEDGAHWYTGSINWILQELKDILQLLK